MRNVKGYDPNKRGLVDGPGGYRGGWGGPGGTGAGQGSSTGGLGPAGGQAQGTTGGGNVGSGFGQSGQFGGQGTGGQGPAGGYYGQSPSSDTDSPGHPSNRTNVSPETDIAEKYSFVNRMHEESDDKNPIKTKDIISLYDTLKAQDINPAQVSIQNFEKGPLAQKNVVTHNNQRIAQFGEVPTFGIAGMLSRFADIDTRGLVLSPSLSGDLDRGGDGGGDLPSTMELLYPTEETLSEEEIAAAEDPTIGYALDYYDQIQPYTTLAAGGLASLPANFNPMTGVNPFRMMMRGGRI